MNRHNPKIIKLISGMSRAVRGEHHLFSAFLLCFLVKYTVTKIIISIMTRAILNFKVSVAKRVLPKKPYAKALGVIPRFPRADIIGSFGNLTMLRF